MIPVLVFILAAIFVIWTFFAIINTAIFWLVNIVIAGAIILRMIHDIKDKKTVSIYLLGIGLGLSLAILGSMIGLEMISKILSRFAIIGIVQVLLLVFIISQLILYIDRKKQI